MFWKKLARILRNLARFFPSFLVIRERRHAKYRFRQTDFALAKVSTLAEEAAKDWKPQRKHFLHFFILSSTQGGRHSRTEIQLQTVKTVMPCLPTLELTHLKRNKGGFGRAKFSRDNAAFFALPKRPRWVTLRKISDGIGQNFLPCKLTPSLNLQKC